MSATKILGIATVCIALQTCFIAILAVSGTIWAETGMSSGVFNDTYLETSVEALERGYDAVMARDLFWSKWDATSIHNRNVKQGLALLASWELPHINSKRRRDLLHSILSAPSRSEALTYLMEFYSIRKMSTARVEEYFEDEERWFEEYKRSLDDGQKNRIEVHHTFVVEAVKLAIYVVASDNPTF